jgi:DNA-binding NarL/FixJ family response regulator
MKPFAKGKATVVLMDNHPVTIAAVSEILTEHCTLLGIATDGKMAVDLIRAFKPEMVILDIAMAGMNGFEVARSLKQHASETRVIFLTSVEDPDYVDAARQLGASYVLKRRMHIDLVLSIKEIMAGHIFSSPLPEP